MKALPSLFIGHGSPMNALGGNEHARFLAKLGVTLPRPTAVLVVSAHWQTKGTKVLASAHPRTIHDFAGFPDELFAVQYPAPGHPELAAHIAGLLGSGAQTSTDWGFDHGSWAILRHIFPDADVPALQLSLDKNLSFSEHYALAGALAPLRSEGVLIIGSGNITHNLGEFLRSPQSPPAAWAVAFDTKITLALETRDLSVLLATAGTDDLWRRAHPTLEHYIPLLYAFGATTDNDAATTIYHEFQGGSLSMRSFQFA